MGIHYDYKSTRGMRAMEKQAKREKKLAEKRAKREIKEGKRERETDNRIDVQEPITLDFTTNPNFNLDYLLSALTGDSNLDIGSACRHNIRPSAANPTGTP